MLFLFFVTRCLNKEVVETYLVIKLCFTSILLYERIGNLEVYIIKSKFSKYILRLEIYGHSSNMSLFYVIMTITFYKTQQDLGHQKYNKLPRSD